MELTPVKISGERRKVDHSRSAVDVRRALNRPKGRPIKRNSSKNAVESLSTANSVKTVKAKSRSLKHIKSKRKMSDLERLPVELLESIFLHCMNLDLPRSSPVIGGKLSSTLIYSRTLMAAFGPTWQTWHCIPRDRRHQKDISGADVGLQSALLRCRWVTLDMLLDTKDTWISKFASDRDFAPVYFSDKTAQQLYHVSTPTAREYFNSDLNGFYEYSQEKGGAALWGNCLWQTTTDVSDGVEIPENLLQGPWTDAMIKYLFWLVKSGARLDWINSTSGEVALSGLQIAIREGDLRALHLLCWAGLRQKADIDALIFAINSAGGDRLAVVNHILLAYLRDTTETDARKLDEALLDLSDKANESSDKAKLDFLGAIKDLASWQYAMNPRTRVSHNDNENV